MSIYTNQFRSTKVFGTFEVVDDTVNSIAASAKFSKVKIRDAKNNILIGSSSTGQNLDLTGSALNNLAIGLFALENCTTGNQNNCVGYGCLASLTTGQANSVIGDTAGNHITTGSNNVGIGNDACNTVTTGSYNTCLNSKPSANTSYSTTLGYGATTGNDHEIAIGTSSETIKARGTLYAENGIDLPSGKTIAANGTTISDTELSYLDGASSNIQTQLTALQTKSTQQSYSSGTTSFSGGVDITNNLTVNGNTTLGNASTDVITINGRSSISDTLQVTNHVECGEYLSVTASGGTTDTSSLPGAYGARMYYNKGGGNGTMYLVNYVSHDGSPSGILKYQVYNEDGTYRSTPFSIDGTEKASFTGLLSLTTTTTPTSGTLGYQLTNSPGSNQTLTTNVVSNVASVTLGVGTWILEGHAAFGLLTGSSGTHSNSLLSISTSSSSEDLIYTNKIDFGSTAASLVLTSQTNNLNVTRTYFASSSTTLYLLAKSNFTVSGSTFGIDYTTCKLIATKIA
jgi:hypothetical protein